MAVRIDGGDIDRLGLGFNPVAGGGFGDAVSTQVIDFALESEMASRVVARQSFPPDRERGDDSGTPALAGRPACSAVLHRVQPPEKEKKKKRLGRVQRAYCFWSVPRSRRTFQFFLANCERLARGVAWIMSIAEPGSWRRICPPCQYGCIHAPACARLERLDCTAVSGVRAWRASK